MTIWLLIFGVGALVLRPGFALQASGSLRAKNAAGAVMRVVVNTAVIALVFWAIGAAILFQTHSRYFGIESSLLFATSPMLGQFEFFHLAIVLIGGAVVAGAIAERAPMVVGMVLSAMLAGFVIPVVGNWIWTGWLAENGFIDIAGATAIHLSAAACAIIAAIVVGPRNGKYNQDGSSNSIPGHALPLSSVGVLLLLVGWFPYLLGCVIAHSPTAESDIVENLSQTAMNLILAAAAGSLAGLLLSHFRYGKPDTFFTYTGLVGAMVAISAGASVISSTGAVVIGAIAGIFVPLITLEIDMRWRVDDPVGVIGAHGFGGLWGTLATALFATTGAGHRLKLLGIQATGIAVTIVFAMVLTGIVMLILKAVCSIRCSEADEFDGLDLGEHDINAYPDFQQTTIKSYHLREA